MQSTNELLASWGVISPWVFPSLWGALAVFACTRRYYGMALLMTMACMGDFLLSYLFMKTNFADGGNIVNVFSMTFPQQRVYTVASLLPTLVNFSLATVMAVLLRSTSKGHR